MLFSFSKILSYGSHCFRNLRLNRGTVLVEFSIDNSEGRDCFFLHDVEFPGIVEEWTSLGNNSGSSEGGGRGRGRTSLCLVAGMGMSVSVTTDFVANEALIVMHVLRSLSRGELDGIHVHSVRVAMGVGGRQGSISSRGYVVVASRPQLFQSLGHVIKLTNFRQPVLVRLGLVFQRHHLEGQVS